MINWVNDKRNGTETNHRNGKLSRSFGQFWKGFSRAKESFQNSDCGYLYEPGVCDHTVTFIMINWTRLINPNERYTMITGARIRTDNHNLSFASLQQTVVY